MKSLCVIPARGGSKGIPNKNLQLINELSLTRLAIQVAEKVGCFEQIFLSTDSDTIAREADGTEAVAFPRRPKEISGDLSSDLELLKHAVNEFEGFDAVCLLQPTSPNRTSRDILAGLELLTSYDSVWSVSDVPVSFAAQKQLTETELGLGLAVGNSGKSIIARQQLPKNYIRNGVFYWFKVEFIRKAETLFDGTIGKYSVTRPVANIDSLDDLEVARNLMGS